MDFLVAQMVKNLPAKAGEVGLIVLGQEDPLEKQMATHSSILAWRIPWTEETGWYSPWNLKESDMTEWLTLSLSTWQQSSLPWRKTRCNQAPETLKPQILLAKTHKKIDKSMNLDTWSQGINSPWRQHF